MAKLSHVAPLAAGLCALLVAACTGGGAPATAPGPARGASESPAVTVTAAPPGPASVAPLAPLSPPVTVRVGTTSALTEAGQIIALQRGYFRELGLQVEYEQFDSAARMIPQLASGQLDVGAGSLSAGLWNAVARGVPIKVTGPQSRHFDNACGFWFTVRKELVDSGQVQEPKDLAGRKIAGPCTDCIGDYILETALATAGLTLADVDYMALGFNDMLAALANRAIDVAVLAEAQATIAESQGFATRWRCTSLARPGYQSTVILYSAPFAEQQAEAARRWMLAYLRGLRDYTDAMFRGQGREAVVQALIEGTVVKDPVLYQRMGWTWLDPNGELNVPSIDEQLNWLRARGKIEGQVQVRDVLDLSFVDFAVQRLGRYDTTGLVQ